MQHNILVYKNENEQARALATLILGQIKYAAKENRAFLLGCPGGRSPLETYKQLALMIGQEQIDISHLVVVMMDDYVIKKNGQFIHCDEHAHYSCRRFANEDIKNRLNANIPQDKHVTQIWFPPINNPEDYDKRLMQAGGIDHFILASGTTDGHVAFNPPYTSKEQRSYIATLSLETRTDNLGTFPDYKNIDEVPLYGLTVGLKTISEQSKQVSLIINGKHKKPAARRVLSAEKFDETWPVSIIYECKNVSIYLEKSCNPLEIV
ncbi:MAG: 6-phosphogluconolactonase [Alphaproteobacteria bacterium]